VTAAKITSERFFGIPIGNGPLLRRMTLPVNLYGWANRDGILSQLDAPKPARCRSSPRALWARPIWVETPDLSDRTLFNSQGKVAKVTDFWGRQTRPNSRKRNPSGTPNAGAVEVFDRTDETWGHSAYLKTPNHGWGDSFGQESPLMGTSGFDPMPVVPEESRSPMTKVLPSPESPTALSK